MINENTLIFYIVFFVFSLFFSIIINSLFLKFSRSFGIKNEGQKERRWVAQNKPSLGGFSFYILFLFSISAYSVLFDINFLNIELIGLLLAISLGFLLGLADDAYGTNPFLKFFGQFICANILVSTGIIIHITPFNTVNYVFTVFWVIGIMNSINMLDNMDGVATIVSISIIAAALIFLIFQNNTNSIYFMLCLGIIAVLIGFLIYNFHPSKIFMGDTGSQFLGVFLAAIAIILFWKFRDNTGAHIQIKHFLIPLLIFIVPIIDTSTVMIRRIGRNQSPFVGGKDHITHQLVFLGLSEKIVIYILGGISFFSAFLAILLYNCLNNWNHWYTVLSIVYFILVLIIIQILYNKGLNFHQRKIYLRLKKRKKKRKSK